jgi:hypothetical protein
MAKGKKFFYYERSKEDADSVGRMLKDIGKKDVKVYPETSTWNPQIRTGRFVIEHFDPTFDNRRSSNAISRRMKKRK